MAASNGAAASRFDQGGRLLAGQLQQALSAALQRSLSVDTEMPAPLDPAVMKPLKLLPRHMLLVGEDKSRQGPALDVLSRWDIAAEVATNGAEALDIAATGEFDLIFIDANKSVLDGVFVSSRLRHLERERQERLTVALVSRVAWEWPSAEVMLRMAGVDDVLKVATDAVAVRECLRRWCCGCYRPAAG